jgi:hypothetical protein
MPAPRSLRVVGPGVFELPVGARPGMRVPVRLRGDRLAGEARILQ